MLQKFFKTRIDQNSLGIAAADLVYAPSIPPRLETKEVERAFARLFSTDDGRKVLAQLQVMTFHRALGASSPDEQLRYMEGQRALVASILRLVDRGRQI